MKAATLRSFIYFLSEVCLEEANLAMPAGAMRAALLVSFVEADLIMRRGGRILSSADSLSLQSSVRDALISYNALSVVFEADNLYHCVPKMHMSIHMVSDQGRINPRWVQCYPDEDMVGRMKLVYSGTHGLTAPLRSLQRYIILVGLRWQHQLNTLRGV
jgi:hypothetical protein